MDDRIWVCPGGLRVRGKGLPGGYWEEDGEIDCQGQPVLFDQEAADEQEEQDESAADQTGTPANEAGSLHERLQALTEELRQAQKPGILWRAWNAIKPVVARIAKPVPRLTVYAGMAATFFLQAYHGIDEEAILSVVDLPEELPVRLAVAAAETIVFALWAWTFRLTIQNAIRAEFEDK